MGATQNNGINQRVAGEEFGEVLLHEIVGTCIKVFASLNQWHPHRACLLSDNQSRVLLEKFDDITLGSHGAWCSEYANMFGACALRNNLNRRADNTQHAQLVGVDVVLLNRAKRLGTGSIAGKDDEIATLLVQVINRLKGVFINDIKRACSIGRTRIVTQVEILILGEMLANVIQDSQSAVTAVENTNQISLQFVVYS